MQKLALRSQVNGGDRVRACFILRSEVGAVRADGALGLRSAGVMQKLALRSEMDSRRGRSRFALGPRVNGRGSGGHRCDFAAQVRRRLRLSSGLDSGRGRAKQVALGGGVRPSRSRTGCCLRRGAEASHRPALCRNIALRSGRPARGGAVPASTSQGGPDHRLCGCRRCARARPRRVWLKEFALRAQLAMLDRDCPSGRRARIPRGLHGRARDARTRPAGRGLALGAGVGVRRAFDLRRRVQRPDRESLARAVARRRRNLDLRL